MKKILRMLLGLVLVLPIGSWAALVTIGSGQMVANGPIYKLIWDNDNNGKSLVWLDFTSTQNPGLTWLHVQAVNASLVYTLDPTYAVTWTDAAWRQPSSGAAVDFCQCPSTFELGHLFYNELGLTAPLVNHANPNNRVTPAELNAGEFDNLVPTLYWQGTDWPGSYFDMGRGASVMVSGFLEGIFTGIAVREGQVSTLMPVPEPSTVLLVAVALAALRLRRRH